MEQVPSHAASPKTVKELIEALSKLDPNLPVSLLIEYSSQYEDSLREIFVARGRVILMGLERICPEYEELNPKDKRD